MGNREWDITDIKEITRAKERLLLHYIAETEDLYKLLSQRVAELDAKNKALHKLSISIIETLARTLEAKDRYTEGHSQRVAFYSGLITVQMGLPIQQKKQIELASILHDLGKIGVSEQVLNKPGKLDALEFEQIKQHPVIAARILQPLKELEPVLGDIEYHHERFDGYGYPKGLGGKNIPLGARIIAVADTFDAMTSDRPYRRALDEDFALREIQRNAGKQFDPLVVECFTSAMASHLLNQNHS